MNKDKYPKLKEIYDAAIHQDSGLDVRDLDGLTLHSKCHLVRDLVGALRAKVPQKIYGNARHTRDVVEALVTSMTPSENLLDFQNKRKAEFLFTLSHPKFAHTRDILAGWEQGEFTQLEEKSALVESVSLHQKVYMGGIGEPVHIDHYFEEELRVRGDRLGQKRLGGFSGDMTTGNGYIRYDTSSLMEEASAKRALEVAHHEMTHGIQFAMAYAYHRNTMSHDHPLFEDAQMFHTIEVKNGYVPATVLKRTEQDAYYNQPQERLAYKEGQELSEAIMALVQG